LHKLKLKFNIDILTYTYKFIKRMQKNNISSGNKTINTLYRKSTSITNLTKKSTSNNTISVNNISNSNVNVINIKTPEELVGYDDDDKIDVTELSKNQDEITITPKTPSFDLNEKVKLSMELKYDVINKNTKQTKMPLVLSINVDEIKSEAKASIDIVCVIDKSGSMRGEKWELLTNSMKSMMEYLNPKDRLSLVVFDSNSKRITPLMTMNEENKAKSIEILSSIIPNGGTDIGEGVRKALEIIRQRRIANNVTSVFILSDGLDGNARYKISHLVSSYNNTITDSYTFNTFGYGADHDPQLMNSIAEMRDGNFYFIDHLEKADECFVDCLGGLVSVVAQDVILTIKPSPLVKITKFYGNFFKTYSNNSWSGKILQLISGKSLDYVVEIEIVDLEKVSSMDSIQIATAICEMKGIKESGYKSFIKTAERNLQLSDDLMILIANKENERVLLHYFRVQSSEAMQQANQFSELGNFDAAKNALVNIKDEIESSSFKNSEKSRLLVADITRSLKSIKPEVFKSGGKHYIVESISNNLRQTSNINSLLSNSNKIQMALRNDLAMKKNNSKK
jgi:Mg-chelatase subunit ChlD